MGGARPVWSVTARFARMRCVARLIAVSMGLVFAHCACSDGDVARVRDHWLGRLRAEDESIRMSALADVPAGIETLPDIESAIVECLKDGSPRVRAAAVEYLGRRASGRVTVIDRLVASLDDNDACIGAVRALRLMGADAGRAAAAISRAATSGPDLLAAEAARSLRDVMGDSKATSDVLTTGLGHTDFLARVAAAQELGRLRTRTLGADQALRRGLDDPVDFVRLECAIALTARDGQDRELEQVLCDLMRTGRDDVRLCVVRLAYEGRIGAESARRIAEAGLGDGDQYVRCMSENVYKRQGELPPRTPGSR